MIDAETRRVLMETLLGKNEQRTAAQSDKYGKSLRKAVPRDVFASWQPPMNRPDPAGLIFSQDADRVKELVPVRHERMAVSPFTFYRGAALVMASDLSTMPTTGIEVQVCGDAHVSNFGLFLSPERRTVFDINDFDETCRGPWEWDVARLVASIEICGRDRNFSDEEREAAVLAAASGYRESMRKFATMGNMDVWYEHFDVDNLISVFGGNLNKKDLKKAQKALQKAKNKNSTRAIGKLTEVVDGQLCVVSDPPIVIPLRNLIQHAETEIPADLDMTKVVSLVLERYRQSLAPERAALVQRYRGVDIAHKVVGVGSVGLQAWIVVLEGANAEDPLVLQIKEATDSVLERFVGKASQPSHGQRVVEGQHAMQTVSDALLGWTTLPMPSGKTRDFYVRQLWDGKGSIDLTTIRPKHLESLARACGWTLAHAHARTGDRFAIASYLGKSTKFDVAMLEFASAYADQNDKDYAAFVAAIAE